MVLLPAKFYIGRTILVFGPASTVEQPVSLLLHNTNKGSKLTTAESTCFFILFTESLLRASLQRLQLIQALLHAVSDMKPQGRRIILPSTCENDYQTTPVSAKRKTGTFSEQSADIQAFDPFLNVWLAFAHQQ